jgi:hypothetical protein
VEERDGGIMARGKMLKTAVTVGEHQLAASSRNNHGLRYLKFVSKKDLILRYSEV